MQISPRLYGNKPKYGGGNYEACWSVTLIDKLSIGLRENLQWNDVAVYATFLSMSCLSKCIGNPRHNLPPVTPINGCDTSQARAAEGSFPKWTRRLPKIRVTDIGDFNP
jgi:hypothetical protein